MNAPVAPTGECLSLLADLNAPVEHLVLPVTALEHKAFFGPFARKFPKATAWVAPGQYGPFGSLGFAKESSTLPFRVDGVLPRSKKDPQPPWASEIDTRTFYVDLPGNAGPVAEAAFFHKKTKTLFVTDAVSWIPKRRTAPDIFRTSFPDSLVDDADFWPKSVLQARRPSGDVLGAVRFFEKVAANHQKRSSSLRARSPPAGRLPVAAAGRRRLLARLRAHHGPRRPRAHPRTRRRAASRRGTGAETGPRD